MNVGAELARARESHGLSLAEVSARTKVSVERLSAIEQNDLAHLPPVLYVRGFVRAYASEVGLDPEAVVERYMLQFKEQPPVAVLGEQPPVAEVKEQVPDAVIKEPPRVAAIEEAPAVDTFKVEPAPEEANKPAPLWRPAEFKTERHHRHIKAPPQPLDAIPGNSDDDRGAAPSMPTRPARSRVPFAMLIVGAVIAVVAGYLVSANLNIFPRDDSSAAQTEVSQSVADGSDPAKPTGEVAPAPGESGPSAPPAKAAQSAAERETAPPDPTRADTRADPPVAADTSDAAPVDDVSGQWTLTTRVESASYTPFQGLTLGYRVQLEQQGNRITGSGHKVTENGRTIAATSRTPIIVEGTLDGRRLELTFTERGARRTSGGTLVMDVADDGTLRGNFSSDAARSRGSSEATRTAQRQ